MYIAINSNLNPQGQAHVLDVTRHGHNATVLEEQNSTSYRSILNFFL